MQLEAVCDGGAFEYRAHLAQELRPLCTDIARAMTSERGRLSGAAIHAVAALSVGLEEAYEPLLPLFVPTLLRLCTKASKLVVSRAHSCLITIIEATHLFAILPYLMSAIKDKAASCRIAASDCVLSCLNCFDPQDLGKESRAKIIEDIIRFTARDASPDVRHISRRLFAAYQVVLPARVERCVKKALQ